MVHESRIVHSSLLTRLWNDRYVYLVLLPVMANFIIFHYGPMLGIQIAFKDYDIAAGMAASPWVGFKNFLDFFGSMYFWELLRNTISISLLLIGFGFPAPILLAILLNEVQHPLFKRSVQTVSYLPYFLSSVIAVSLLRMILDPDSGIVNIVIQAFGGQSISFLQEPKYFRAIYLCMSMWQWTGFSAIIYLAAITAIDTELYEAAEIDGAGRLSRIWHITLAGLAPTIIIMFILRLGGIMDVGFLEILLLQNNMNREVSDIIQTFVYQRGLLNSDYGYATAVGFFQSVISFIFVLSSNAISKKVSGNYVF